MKNWFSSASKIAKRANEGLFGVRYDSSTDSDFDHRTRLFFEQVNQLNKAKDAMEMWLDSLENYCACSLLLSNAFQQFHIQPPVSHSNRDSLTSSTSNSVMSNETNQLDSLDRFKQKDGGPYLKAMFIDRCLKPVLKILSLVPSILEAIQERKKIVAEFESCRLKIQKEMSSGKADSQVSLKTSERLVEVSTSLASIQSTLLDHFERFNNVKPMMLGQEMAAALATQLHFHTIASHSLSRLGPLLPQSATTLCLLHMSHPPLESMPSHDIVGDLHKHVMESTGTLALNNASFNTRKSSVGSVVAMPTLLRPEVLGGEVGGYGLPEEHSPLPSREGQASYIDVDAFEVDNPMSDDSSGPPTSTIKGPPKPPRPGSKTTEASSHPDSG